MHKRHALMALRAGKAVLCEKPMTCAKADTEELIRVATEQGVLLCEAMWTRFFPTVRHARQLLASGDIGQVLQMHGDFGFRFPDVDTNTTHRLTDPALGGGATLDIGVYPIACMLLAFGATPPREVAVAGQLHASGVDKTVGVTATWDDGKVAHMTWSATLPPPPPHTLTQIEILVGGLGTSRLLIAFPAKCA
jgi:dihydrodiol dehydrogenase / D-xylose 1-dehydrogenase (NADP)